MSLEEQADIKYPMPKNPCVWVRARVEWKRKQWIEEQKKATKKLINVAVIPD